MDVAVDLTNHMAYALLNNPSLFFLPTIPTGPAYYLIESLLTNPNLEGLLYGLTIGLKSSIMIFVFI
jgi:hypothetical protein